MLAVTTSHLRRTPKRYGRTGMPHKRRAMTTLQGAAVNGRQAWCALAFLASGTRSADLERQRGGQIRPEP